MAVTDVRWLRRRRPVFRWEAEGREEPADEARRAPVLSASLHLFALSREQLVMSAAAAGHQHVFMLVFIFFS